MFAMIKVLISKPSSDLFDVSSLLCHQHEATLWSGSKTPKYFGRSFVNKMSKAVSITDP